MGDRTSSTVNFKCIPKLMICIALLTGYFELKNLS